MWYICSMSWYRKIQDKFRKKLAKDLEDLVYTAQKGSTLDRIWNKEDCLTTEQAESALKQSNEQIDKICQQK